MYLTPTFDIEDLKANRRSENIATLQTLQNDMIRVVLNLKRKNHVNMQKVRERIKMMSVNQMAIYHTLLEAFNVIRKSSSEQIQKRWTNNHEKNHQTRSVSRNDLIVPDKPKVKCTGFTYFASKLFNKLPMNIREAPNENAFKILVKNYIWKTILSY